MSQRVSDTGAGRREGRNISTAIVEVGWNRSGCGGCTREPTQASWTGFGSETSVYQVSITVVEFL